MSLAPLLVALSILLFGVALIALLALGEAARRSPAAPVPEPLFWAPARPDEVPPGLLCAYRELRLTIEQVLDLAVGDHNQLVERVAAKALALARGCRRQMVWATRLNDTALRLEARGPEDAALLDEYRHRLDELRLRLVATDRRLREIQLKLVDISGGLCLAGAGDFCLEDMDKCVAALEELQREIVPAPGSAETARPTKRSLQ